MGMVARSALARDLATPCARLPTARLDELLEPLEIALDAAVGDAEDITQLLLQALGHEVHLLDDLRVPLMALAAELRDPVKPAIVELPHLLDSLHEPGKVLELRPLVVGGCDWHVDFDRLLDRCVHLRSLCSCPAPLPEANGANPPQERKAPTGAFRKCLGCLAQARLMHCCNSRRSSAASGSTGGELTPVPYTLGAPDDLRGAEMVGRTGPTRSRPPAVGSPRSRSA